MGLRSFFREFFTGEKDEVKLTDLPSNINTVYKYLAIGICINLIASTLSLAEFQTKENGEKVKKREYYKLNIEPNKNTAAAQFWRSVIEKLVNENSCLVVKIDDEYHIAESFERQEFALKQNIYRNVVVGRENPYTLKDVFLEKDVFYFRWHNLQVLDLVHHVYNDLLELISASKDNYLLMARLKVLIKRDGMMAQTPEAQQAYQDLINLHLKRFLDPSQSNALPLMNGIGYEDVSRKSTGTSNNISRETKGYINDGLEMVAMAFQIPPQLLKGEVQGLDDAFRFFMTTCIKPLSDIISDEINRKLYKEEGYFKGNKVFIDTTKIRYVDIKDIAPSLEALTRIGVNTIDDNLEYVGREGIGSTQRWMTKNYDMIENFKIEET